jgi:hypothetical protein
MDLKAKYAAVNAEGNALAQQLAQHQQAVQNISARLAYLNGQGQLLLEMDPTLTEQPRGDAPANPPADRAVKSEEGTPDA